MEGRIDLRTAQTHGNVTLGMDGGTLHIDTPEQNLRFFRETAPVRAYAEFPGQAHLPFCMELDVSVDAGPLILLIGEGHLTFGSWIDNRSIGDIVAPDPKKPGAFVNTIEMGKPTRILVSYGFKAMTIMVDGELRYASKREPYMRASALRDRNAEGFRVAIAGGKQTLVSVSECVISACEEPIVPEGFVPEKPLLSVNRKIKATFDECIAALPAGTKKQVQETNDLLLGLKRLKVRRKVEGDARACKITYVASEHGFSYALQISGGIMTHFFWWYLVSNRKYEGKFMGRKNDMTAQVFDRMLASDKETAARLVSYYEPCVGCVPHCSARTIYKIEEKTIVACHDKMVMNMRPQTFEDMRSLFTVIEALV